MKPLRNLLFALILTAFALTLILTGNYLTLPTRNTAATRFDTLIVLGYPTNPDGTPSPEQRERVLEAVREYQSGVAPHLIMTGTAAHNSYIEAHAMAQLAIASGVPASAVLEEPQAQNTIQNLFYSARIMHQHGWSTAEIVSSPSHLPRAAYIANALNQQQPALSIDWRTHPARWPAEYNLTHRLLLYLYESSRCLQVRISGVSFTSLHH